ncbi:MAG: tRNA lysidine(34) synthetase TilS [Candidatus Saccharimonadales bacterium]
MKYVVAVSGGVDSVVLLDMLVKTGEHELVVAHFDHGIRNESTDDANFVAGLAAQYGLPFKVTQGHLGSAASEELARNKRYEFLKGLAESEAAKLVTAHHSDDVVESIAINLTRGTGWRGLAVLNDSAIERPLIDVSKAQLYDYALSRGLEWVEDETNQSDRYLRNRLRRKLGAAPEEAKRTVRALRNEQCRIAKRIDEECAQLQTTSRYFFTMIDDAISLELLRHILAENSASLTRPQRRRLLLGIKTAAAGTTLDAGNGIKASFTSRNFIVKQPL